MDFTTACAFVMPFGKYKGKWLSRIGANPEGLKYLDWLIGQDWLKDNVKEPLAAYLKHPAIALQLDAAIEDD